jgi:hypothetical protein
MIQKDLKTVYKAFHLIPTHPVALTLLQWSSGRSDYNFRSMEVFPANTSISFRVCAIPPALNVLLLVSRRLRLSKGPIESRHLPVCHWTYNSPAWALSLSYERDQLDLG